MIHDDDGKKERARQKRRLYYVRHRAEINAKNFHRPRNILGTYVCPRCGRRDTLDGSERAASGLCLDCWCHDENRKSDAWYAKRIAEVHGDAVKESDYHRAGQSIVAAAAIARAIEEGDSKRAAEKFRRDCRRDEYLARPEVRERRNANARARYHAMDAEAREAMLAKRREKRRAYYRANRERILEKQRARSDYFRAYYEAHKEELRAYRREWKRKHKASKKKEQDNDGN